MDNPRDHELDFDPPPMPSEDELRAALDESEEDVAAGRTFPASEVLSELVHAIEEMEAKRRSRRT